jgi:hypothetical protein
MNLPSSTLAIFEDWEKPTLQNVVDVFEKLKINDENFTLILGLNVRTYRRWTLKRAANRLEKSPIPYGVWCVLIALSENKYIFGHVLQHDKTKVPASYIFSIENFVSPPKEILTLFVGKKSITGLQRTELAGLFGWNSTYLGREFNNGSISFLNWVLLLLFCGVSVGRLIKIKPTGEIKCASGNIALNNQPALIETTQQGSKMKHSTVEEIIAKQKLQYDTTRASNTRGTSALALLNMALEHGSDSAHAAATLLIAMEKGQDFDFRLLLKFDPVHRAHADTLILGYKPHYIWPSKWIEEENAGIDATALFDHLSD